MFKRSMFLILMVVTLLSCAKKSTEFKEKHILQLNATVQTVGNPLDLDTADSLVYVAEDQGGISIINTNDYSKRWIPAIRRIGDVPQNLVHTAKIKAIKQLNRLLVTESLGSDAILILDTSAPDSLTLSTSVVGGTSNIKDMSFNEIIPVNPSFSFEGYCCVDFEVKYGTYGEHAIGSPHYFNFTKSYEAPSTTQGAFFTNQYVFAAIEERGLIIFNRASTAVVSELDLPGEALKVKVVGNYAYLPCRQDGLQIVDISNPAAPFKVGSFDTTGYATNVDIWNNYAIVSSGGGGVYLFDVTNPANPILADHITDCGYANDVKFYNGKAIVASRDHGVMFYNIVP